MQLFVANLGQVRVEFSNSTYSGSESSSEILVTLHFSKGISTSTVKVKVKPNNKSPLSAQGM